MGTLRSFTNWTMNEDGTPADPVFVNGVRLGEPVELDGDPSTFEWDDSAFPNGIVTVVDGVAEVTPDEVTDDGL